MNPLGKAPGKYFLVTAMRPHLLAEGRIIDTEKTTATPVKTGAKIGVEM